MFLLSKPKNIFFLTVSVIAALTVLPAPVQEAQGKTGYVTDENYVYTVWHRIRDGFKIPDMDNSYVERNLQIYADQPDYLQRMADRSSWYIYYIIQEVEKRHMPSEVALLPFVESAFVTTAKSRVKAAGLWQFMPSTGRHFSLDQNMWKDDRNDVLQSTSAALTYLQQLHRRFNNWPLAFAAYNWGEGNVSRAIKKNQSLGLPTDYMSLSMPNETKNYYPKLQAIKDIVRNPKKYGVKLPLLYNEPRLVQIYKDQDIDIKRAAQLANMKEADFRQLNPSFNRPVIVASHRTYILLPSDRVDKFVENLVAYRTSGKPLSSWSTYRVQDGDSLDSIAERAQMTVDELRSVNKIPSDRIVKPGSILLVNRNSELGRSADIPPDTLHGSLSLDYEYRKVAYRVRKGDTLPGIAKKLGVSESAITSSNKLTKGKLKVGQTLVVKVPNRGAGQKAAAEPAAPAPAEKTVSKVYVVKKGDTLSSISRQFDIPVADIKSANGMKNNIVTIGQRLTIDKDGKAAAAEKDSKKTDKASDKDKKKDSKDAKDTKGKDSKSSDKDKDKNKKDAKDSKDSKSKDKASDEDKKDSKSSDKDKKSADKKDSKDSKDSKGKDKSSDTYTIQKGDTLISIAAKHNLSVSELKKLNNKTDNKIKYGQKLKVK